jgi:hypothetical protein
MGTVTLTEGKQGQQVAVDGFSNASMFVRLGKFNCREEERGREDGETGVYLTRTDYSQ